MNDSKRQTLIMIGISLIVIGGILIYVGFSQPRVYVDSTDTSNQQTTQQSESNNSSVTVVAEKDSADVSYPVNLNSATYDELITIEGIGDARANQILQYRDAIGGYSSVEQIKEISGIGEATYNQIAPYLTV